MIILVGLWLTLAAYLTRVIDFHSAVPQPIKSLTLPKTTSDLATSLTALDGLFSSLAIVLGLVAIIFQGRELKESIRAQAEQVRALMAQMSQQREANKVAAYTVRLQFLLEESSRLGADLERLIAEVSDIKDEPRFSIRPETSS